jgi:hypothetical protein
VPVPAFCEFGITDAVVLCWQISDTWLRLLKARPSITAALLHACVLYGLGSQIPGDLCVSGPFRYDVFLSHTSRDKPRVEKLAQSRSVSKLHN